MKPFKIRAHATGDICAGEVGLTEAQSAKLIELQTRTKALTPNMEAELTKLLFKQANPQLPDTAKKYCQKWLKEQVYSKRSTFTSKYTDKGNAVELDAFKMIGDLLGFEAQKNDEFFSNDFIEGTPDIVDGRTLQTPGMEYEQLLIDAKSSWDCFTFPLFETEPPDDGNYWQGQSYMDLTGIDKCKFIYCLCDTPEKIIQSEARRACLNNGFDLTPEALAEWTEQLTYANIDAKYKIKVFDIARSQADIDKIYERVKMCRNYIQTLILP